MALSKQQFARYIKDFNFKELFNDMGWDNDNTNQPIVVNDQAFQLKGIAEKRGFKILLCSPDDKGTIPDYKTRRLIESKLTKLFQEHLIIYCDAKKQEQIWQVAIRQAGKPTKVSDTRYLITQDPELLYQRTEGIFFEMDEEEKITIVDVTRRVHENFQQNNERVTKQFYERFKKEHTSFLAFIKGIDSKTNKDWYASLMLNRLMFCYFIQKKGFLDRNKNYLRDKLRECKDKKGKPKFYSFYRNFLLVLFHEGLNEPSQRKDVKIEIGTIPYLNGGLFDEHELEKNFDIDIDDKAFERIFDFFDEWEWHLDTRKEATGKDINPDVIGYIFEKYINDRAQMGAYYTKEDITDYISKNCIIPWLFDETKRNYPKTFAVNGEIASFLISSGDEYIYDAVKYGVDTPLPEEIKAGIKEVRKRTAWNTTASPEAGLPTEIWREVIERRNRYKEVKKKIKNGEVQSINDFITYNLNIRQFAQDVIENTSDPEFLKAFYKSLNKITILDPTCGSGAFLFAAMNVLEPLYDSCITRMRGFTDDEDRENEQKKKTFRNRYKYFREVLENIQNETHPNREYFIYKSIILNNLYGVDIMKEAVEIAKLRLFLKLVATVEADYKKRNLGLEPLPDIDFNIRAGNTLVGFATREELDKGLRYTLDGVAAAPAIEEKCETVANAFKRYKEIQLSFGDDYAGFKKAKAELNKRLRELNNELNKLLHKQAEGIPYDKWLESYKPFHWFAEFYEIVHDRKGFDVIIGNPPYVEYKDIKSLYTIKNFVTEKCSNLFAFILERCMALGHAKTEIGMIVPLSAFSTDRMIPLIEVLKKKSTHILNANFSWRPGKLFEGVNLQLTILLMKIGQPLQGIQSTRYIMWHSESRPNLFSRIEYASVKDKRLVGSIPKLGNTLAVSILEKLRIQKKELGACFAKHSDNLVYYRRGGLYWKVFVDFLTNSSEEKIIKLFPEIDKYSIIASLSSSLWWWYFTITSDCRHLGNRDFETFPFDPREIDNSLAKKISSLGKKYVEDLKWNAEDTVRVYKGKNSVEVLSFRVNQSKPIIDEIDKVLAQHYGFTDEELDFIINYDIKYRMGKELDED